MDRILNRICSIGNHPVACLDENFRLRYVTGLASCLYALSKGSDVSRMFFSVWANSIVGNDVDSKGLWHEDIKAAVKAISIQRKGIKFFSMKYHFLFDVFYLLQDIHSGNKGGSTLETTRQYLEEKVCGWYTKRALQEVFDHFKSGTPCHGINKALSEHRELNESHCRQKEKRVLVVANVSAGKSTLINALIGCQLNRTKTTACTSRITEIHNKPSYDGLTIKTLKGTYRYYDDTEAVSSDAFISAALHFKSAMDSASICLIDTPGINNAEESEHRRITEEAINGGDYDAMIYVSNCQYFGTNDEHYILELLKKYVRKPIFFVLNQLDNFRQKDDSISKMLNDYVSDLVKMGFKAPKIFPVSAKAALLFKLAEAKMDEEDNEIKAMVERKFQKDYFDLPHYLGVGGTTHLLERTGITYLEKELFHL